VYYWNHGAFSHHYLLRHIEVHHPESFSFTPSDSFKHSKKIVNVVPGDFTHSGKLDLLVMSPSQVDGNLDLTVYFSRVGDGFGKWMLRRPIISLISKHYPDVENPMIIASSSLPQPIPIDIDGDMKIDLLGMTPTSRGSSDAPLQVWKNVWNASSSSSPLFQM
jgi:integrin alpha FG-GAP repeat containing protein 1